LKLFNIPNEKGTASLKGEKYARVPNKIRTMDRSSAVLFFIQPMKYKPSHDVILSEAQNLGLLLDATVERDELYIHTSRGRSGRQIDHHTEEFVNATRIGTAV
jgi:hypothetical protein